MNITRVLAVYDYTTSRPRDPACYLRSFAGVACTMVGDGADLRFNWVHRAIVVFVQGKVAKGGSSNGDLSEGVLASHIWSSV